LQAISAVIFVYIFLCSRTENFVAIPVNISVFIVMPNDRSREMNEKCTGQVNNQKE
jgi:hypothetical protein